MPVLASMGQLTEWLDFCLNRAKLCPRSIDTGFNRVGFRMKEAERSSANSRRGSSCR